jgi:hypothetical protein
VTSGSNGLDVLAFAGAPTAAHLEGFDTADMLAAKLVVRLEDGNDGGSQ